MGSVGSGKSLLLLAMCGEARLAAGTGSVVGKLAYVDKNPFFLDDTVRANILFGNDYNDELYWRVIKVCALAEDIGQWRDHDLTAISDGGSNISGGQKARLALARAVYTQADIYILDDPLSAVDPKVRRHLLDHVLLNTGILGDKLRVVSMNSDHLKPFANKNIFLENRKATVEVQAQPRLHSIATNR
ncbi:ATPase-like protein, partial [Linderina macrospora]